MQILLFFGLPVLVATLDLWGLPALVGVALLTAVGVQLCNASGATHGWLPAAHKPRFGTTGLTAGRRLGRNPWAVYSPAIRIRSQTAQVNRQPMAERQSPESPESGKSRHLPRACAKVRMPLAGKWTVSTAAHQPPLVHCICQVGGVVNLDVRHGALHFAERRGRGRDRRREGLLDDRAQHAVHRLGAAHVVGQHQLVVSRAHR